METAIPRVSLDPWREKKRRLAILIHVVPRLLNRILAPLLGWRRLTFFVGMLFAAPGYRKRFARASDDDGLREVKRTFLLVGVLYNRLRDRFGEDIAYRAAHDFIYGLGNAVQRRAYFPPRGEPRKWEFFHQEHEAQMREGFIRNNENDGIQHSENQVSLHITRCRFFEAFRDMGNARLTEAFCESDETVFNDYSPEMLFHRGTEVPNTIARGARRCTFIYSRRTSDGAALRVAE